MEELSEDEWEAVQPVSPFAASARAPALVEVATPAPPAPAPTPAPASAADAHLALRTSAPELLPVPVPVLVPASAPPAQSVVGAIIPRRVVPVVVHSGILHSQRGLYDAPAASLRPRSASPAPVSVFVSAPAPVEHKEVGTNVSPPVSEDSNAGTKKVYNPRAGNCPGCSKRFQQIKKHVVRCQKVCESCKTSVLRHPFGFSEEVTYSVHCQCTCQTSSDDVTLLQVARTLVPKEVAMEVGEASSEDVTLVQMARTLLQKKSSEKCKEVNGETSNERRPGIESPASSDSEVHYARKRKVPPACDAAQGQGKGTTQTQNRQQTASQKRKRAVSSTSASSETVPPQRKSLICTDSDTTVITSDSDSSTQPHKKMRKTAQKPSKKAAKKAPPKRTKRTLPDSSSGSDAEAETSEGSDHVSTPQEGDKGTTQTQQRQRTASQKRKRAVSSTSASSETVPPQRKSLICTDSDTTVITSDSDSSAQPHKKMRKTAQKPSKKAAKKCTKKAAKKAPPKRTKRTLPDSSSGSDAEEAETSEGSDHVSTPQEGDKGTTQTQQRQQTASQKRKRAVSSTSASSETVPPQRKSLICTDSDTTVITSDSDSSAQPHKKMRKTAQKPSKKAAKKCTKKAAKKAPPKRTKRTLPDSSSGSDAEAETSEGSDHVSTPQEGSDSDLITASRKARKPAKAAQKTQSEAYSEVQTTKKACAWADSESEEDAQKTQSKAYSKVQTNKKASAWADSESEEDAQKTQSKAYSEVQTTKKACAWVDSESEEDAQNWAATPTETRAAHKVKRTGKGQASAVRSAHRIPADGQKQDPITCEALVVGELVTICSPDGSQELSYNIKTLRRIAEDKGGWKQPPHFSEPMCLDLVAFIAQLAPHLAGPLGKKKRAPTDALTSLDRDLMQELVHEDASTHRHHANYESALERFAGGKLSRRELYFCPFCWEHALPYARSWKRTFVEPKNSRNSVSTNLDDSTAEEEATPPIDEDMSSVAYTGGNSDDGFLIDDEEDEESSVPSKDTSKKSSDTVMREKEGSGEEDEEGEEALNASDEERWKHEVNGLLNPLTVVWDLVGGRAGIVNIGVNDDYSVRDTLCSLIFVSGADVRKHVIRHHGGTHFEQTDTLRDQITRYITDGNNRLQSQPWFSSWKHKLKTSNHAFWKIGSRFNVFRYNTLLDVVTRHHESAITNKV